VIVAYRRVAAKELDRAIQYYEECRSGLGEEFYTRVQETVARVIRTPEAWPAGAAGTRRALVNRFPYAVIYRVSPGILTVVAIASTSQRPGYWRHRL
jgi:hypothetical protein